MKHQLLFVLLALSSISCFGQKIVNCQINTDLGVIEIELYADKAPLTVENFLQYVDAGKYSNSSFFRVCTPENEATREIKIEVIQGGNLANKDPFGPIEIETTDKTGLVHNDGTLSMARSGPNTATSQFFICIGNQPALDHQGARSPDGYGFAAFGKVTMGMNIVRQIQQGENTKQRLNEPVKIVSITRMDP